MQSDIEFLESLRAQIVAHQTPPVVLAMSPTGRTPNLIWTPKRQAIYSRLQLDGLDPANTSVPAQWGRLLKANALGARYGDTGLWATLLYQATGDVTYAAKAMSVITKSSFWTGTLVSNGFREYGTEYVIMLDWLWPALTDEQRALYFAALDRACLAALGLNAVTTTLRLGDSDQTTGTYFTVACYAQAFGDVHPPAAEFFARPIVGGLDSTGSDLTTIRNAVRTYLERAAGGEWIESGEYNVGTVSLLLLGVAALGIDHFPEVARWLPLAATRHRQLSSPDLKQIMQWGDDQGPHAFEVNNLVTNALLFDDPHSRRFVADAVGQYKAVGAGSGEPWAKGFLLADPYGSVAAKETLPVVFDCSAGQGLVVARPSWAPNAAQVMTHFPATHPLGRVDHSVLYFGDVQLYRRGSWALTHPIAYGANDGRTNNSMLHCGHGVATEWSGALSVAHGSDWLYTAGTSGGSLNAAANYNFFIPTFWHEFSRSVLTIFGEVDTLVVFDRSHVVDPQTLPNFAKYPAAVQTKIKAAPLRAWRWHSPVAPTVLGHEATWPIPSGWARVTWFRDDLVPTVVDQAVAMAGYNMAAAEKKWHLELAPPNAPGFQTLLTVLQFGDPAQMATCARLDFGDVQGVQLSSAGQPDQVALFHAIPGPVLPSPISTKAYDPRVPDLLKTCRIRTTPVTYIPPAGSRVWGPETAAGVVVTG